MNDYLECMQEGLRCLILMKLILLLMKRIKIRRWWTKIQLMEPVRQEFGTFERIFHYLKENDQEEFKLFTGMSVEEFNILLELVRERLTKRSKRKPLSAELRLSAVLNYLVNGKSVQNVSWFFLIGRSTMYKLIPEVCTAIYRSLKVQYLSFPSNQNAWEAIAFDFYKKYKFPNCLGAIDRKHYRIKKPTHSGSFFFNYKKYYSIVLMAVCDSFGCFTWISIGDFGSLNDISIFNNSNLGRALEAKEIDLPANNRLPGSNLYCPFFLIGDGGFPLREYLLTPFRKIRNLLLEEKIFNIRLSHARMTIERAFGIITKKFKVFEQPLDFNLKVSEVVIASTICIHNFLLTRKVQRQQDQNNSSDDSSIDSEDSAPDDTNYIDSDTSDSNHEISSIENSYNDELNLSPEEFDEENINHNRMVQVEDHDEGVIDGAAIRDQLKTYFVSPAGNVPFQWLKL